MTRAEIVAVGTELLSAGASETNGGQLADRLASLGIDTVARQMVGDRRDDLVGALTIAARRAQIVLVTGGLGPTSDDLTRVALAELAGDVIVDDAQLRDALAERFAMLGRRDVPEANWVMATRPSTATPLANAVGTAPGLALDVSVDGRSVLVIAFPGPPAEMAAVADAHLERLLADRGLISGVRVRRTLATAGLWESVVAERLADVDEQMRSMPGMEIAYLASAGVVRVVLSAQAATDADAQSALEPFVVVVRERLGDAVLSGATLPDTLLEMCQDRAVTIATAESLTGGGVGAALTAVPGSSSVYLGSIVAYTHELKASLLGVDRDLLARRGAVDVDVAAAMARGVCAATGATLGIATTGVAGPDASDGKAAGTVFVAAHYAGTTRVASLNLPGGRAGVRALSVSAALDTARRLLLGVQSEDSGGTNSPASQR